MLSKDKRLNLKKDFKWVVAGPLRPPRLGGAGSEASKKLETKYLKLFIKLGDNKTPKVGIAVSGRAFKKAVERNRARRLTSAAFEALYPNLPSAINIVALPKAGVINVKSGDIILDLEEGLKREGIL